VRDACISVAHDLPCGNNSLNAGFQLDDSDLGRLVQGNGGDAERVG
jgi:hypothetical protein